MKFKTIQNIIKTIIIWCNTKYKNNCQLFQNNWKITRHVPLMPGWSIWVDVFELGTAGIVWVIWFPGKFISPRLIEVGLFQMESHWIFFVLIPSGSVNLIGFDPSYWVRGLILPLTGWRINVTVDSVILGSVPTAMNVFGAFPNIGKRF